MLYFLLRLGHVSVKDFIVRLEQRAKVILGEKVGSFTIEGKIPQQSIDLKKKRQVALIFKEAVYNSARHAHATRVDILVKR